MIYYIIYKTTNLIDKKYYIGCHQTSNIEDGYLGSGKHLKRAIKKYGRENFKFEILHFVDSKEKMFELEKNIVNEEIVRDSQTYNLKIGGSGGNPGIVGAFSGRKHSKETKEKQRIAASRQTASDQTRKKQSDNHWSKRNPIAQSKHASEIASLPRSLEHNKKVAEANIGKIVVNNGIVAKRIEVKDLKYYEDLGWKKGGMPRKRI